MSRLFHKVPSFAPDYSGACSVFHDMGGMIVYCDPGGCAGNTMAFDEPRRAISKRVFSLALREKGIIVGMDKKAKQKIVNAHKLAGGDFIVLLGTPVSTVIGTDFAGLAKEISKEAKVPALSIPTSGLYAYDDGQKKAYHAILECAPHMPANRVPDVHIIGATPLDAWDLNQKDRMISLLKECGYKDPLFWGEQGTFQSIGNLEKSRLNIAVSVSAVSTVKALHETYGTPYKTGFPVGEQAVRKWKKELADADCGKQKEKKTVSVKRVLIVGEQVASNMVREMLEMEYEPDRIDVMTFFDLDGEIARAGDKGRLSEKEFRDILKEREPYDVIIGDELLTRAVPYHAEKIISIPNIALSGLAFIDQSPILFGECGSRYFEMEFVSPEEKKNIEI